MGCLPCNKKKMQTIRLCERCGEHQRQYIVKNEKNVIVGVCHGCLGYKDKVQTTINI